MIAQSGVNAVDVKAIATTGMVPAIVCLDGEGRPLRRAILQNDARAVVQIVELAESLAEHELVSETGSALTQQSVAPTARWLRDHEPQPWRETKWIVGSYDWLLMALGAEPHIELNWAHESGLFTLAAEPFNPVLDAAQIQPGILPAVRASGQVVGYLNASAASVTGLATDTLLVVGGADHVLSAYAAGVENDGDWLVKLGGAGDLLAASSTPVFDARLYLDAHPRPGLWLPNGCMATSGSLIRWVQELVGGIDLQALDAEAADKSAGEVLCLPYFLGEKSPLHDPELRGTFAGLRLGHDRADLYRSVLEGIAFGFRHNAEVLRDCGVRLDRATVTNGGSTSMLWKRIHASVLGVELATVLDHPGASLGAGIIAGIGAGELAGWDDVVRFIKPGPTVEPESALVVAYDSAYAHWRELATAVTPISHALARI